MDHRIGTCSACKATYRIPSSFAANRARCRQCGGVVEISPVDGQAAPPRSERREPHANAVAATLSAVREPEPPTTAKSLHLSEPASAAAPAPAAPPASKPAPAATPAAAKPAAPAQPTPSVARPATQAPRKRTAPPPPSAPSKAVPIGIGALVAIVLAALGWFFFVRETPSPKDAGPRVEAQEPAQESLPAPQLSAASDAAESLVAPSANALPESAPADD